MTPNKTFQTTTAASASIATFMIGNDIYDNPQQHSKKLFSLSFQNYFLVNNSSSRKYTARVIIFTLFHAAVILYKVTSLRFSAHVLTLQKAF